MTHRNAKIREKKNNAHKFNKNKRKKKSPRWSICRTWDAAEVSVYSSIPSPRQEKRLVKICSTRDATSDFT